MLPIKGALLLQEGGRFGQRPFGPFHFRRTAVRRHIVPGIRAPFPAGRHLTWVVHVWQAASRYLHFELAAHRAARKPGFPF
jgi:hypothetical protein